MLIETNNFETVGSRILSFTPLKSFFLCIDGTFYKNYFTI